MKIEVTADDIANGQKNSGTQCPVAKALERITGRVWFVLKYNARPAIGPPGIFYDLPLEVRQFIMAFDAGGAVQPFSFDLDIAGAVLPPPPLHEMTYE